MLNKNLKKTPQLIIALIVFSLSILYFPTQSLLIADPAIQENVSSPEGSKPIIVYYSRTGKTRIVANTLKEQLTCEIAEIKSTENREGFFGVITCVLDSLLDRDDIIEPFNKDLKGYNPIIIASPIWIGKLSSPVRTLIKQAELKDKEVKQIQLFPAKDVAATKQYNVDSNRGNDVRVVMRFENSEESGLGVPLPAGKVRVFKADVDGSLEFLGEDRIDHTPRNEEVKVYVGNAFDIVSKRIRTDYEKISDRVTLETFEITVSNHKDEDVVVTVTEHIHGDWDVRRESHPFEKLKSDTIEFKIPVAADGEAVLTYTVRRKF